MGREIGMKKKDGYSGNGIGDKDEEEDEDEQARRSDSNPAYTPEELWEIVLDFYKFLGTLHHDPDNRRSHRLEGGRI